MADMLTTPSQEHLDKLKKENKTKVFNLRLTPTEMSNLGKNALKAGKNISTYIVDLACK